MNENKTNDHEGKKPEHEKRFQFMYGNQPSDKPMCMCAHGFMSCELAVALYRLHCHVLRICENVYIIRTENNFIARIIRYLPWQRYVNNLLSSFVIFSIHSILFI